MRIHSRRSLKLPVLFIVALLAFSVTVWTSLSIDAAPASQDITSPLETPTVTPTITPTKPPVRNEITFPVKTDILIAYARVMGTAVIDNYREYQLHIAPANSEQWSWLTTGYNVVRDNSLYIFDSRLLADGFYDLRLRAINVRGNYTESFVRGFEIRNLNPPTPTPEITRQLAEGELPLPPLSPLETPTPVATPDFESFVPGGQGIYRPGNGEKLKSVQAVVGTVNGRGPGKHFQRYEIYLSPAGMEVWEWLYASQQQLFNEVIYWLDTSRFANGSYDLRLRIVYVDSNYDEYHTRNLTIANNPALIERGPTLQIKQPQTGALVVGQMDIRGTLTHPELSRWELYWSVADGAVADDHRQWLLLYTGEYQVVDDLIARLDLGQVAAGRYDVRVRLVRRDGNYEDAFIRRLYVALPTATPPPSPHR
ncbi:MAG: hypothetical protein DWI57_06225 [Chloroflexi bacterium]|nr:MAG: hypothetical protein DWI57_06225 [Chloroflexota bacterium]